MEFLIGVKGSMEFDKSDSTTESWSAGFEDSTESNNSDDSESGQFSSWPNKDQFGWSHENQFENLSQATGGEWESENEILIQNTIQTENSSDNQRTEHKN